MSSRAKAQRRQTGFSFEYKYTDYSISNFFNKINSFFAYNLPSCNAVSLAISDEIAQKRRRRAADGIFFGNQASFSALALSVMVMLTSMYLLCTWSVLPGAIY